MRTAISDVVISTDPIDLDAWRRDDPMTMPLDAHGQPPRRPYRERVNDRLVAELLGVVNGAICDGAVSDTEARALAQWIDSHPDVGRDVSAIEERHMNAPLSLLAFVRSRR